jgi:hypothetical protein
MILLDERTYTSRDMTLLSVEGITTNIRENSFATSPFNCYEFYNAVSNPLDEFLKLGRNSDRGILCSYSPSPLTLKIVARLTPALKISIFFDLSKIE